MVEENRFGEERNPGSCELNWHAHWGLGTVPHGCFTILGVSHECSAMGDMSHGCSAMLVCLVSAAPCGVSHMAALSF